MNNQAIATRSQSEIEPTRDPESILRFAIERNADVAVIEKVMAVRRELRAEQAKEAFDRALKAFQAECPVVVKEKAVPDRSGHTAYKFAPIEAIKAQIRPFEQKHGFYHTFPVSATEPGWMAVTCKVTHEMGHSEPAVIKYPVGTKTAIMSDTQQYAALETFIQRRALCAAYGLTIAGEDIDGQTGKLKPAGPSALKPSATNPKLKEFSDALWALLTPVRGTERNWNQANQWLWKNEILDAAVPESAPNLKLERWPEVIEKARKALKQ